MNRRDVLTLGLAALLPRALAAGTAIAQTKYPERPIRLVVPAPPGGQADALGRPWADRMKSLLGTVVVENIGGAGGSLGAAHVARAQPDGYTILLGLSGTHVITPIAARRPSYDPIQDFQAIYLLALTSMSILVNPSLPVRTLQQLVDYAKANPGKLSYGSAGGASLPRLTGELFKSLSGIADIMHVPYRGGGPLIQDLVGGHIPVAISAVTGQVIELHRSGQLRMIAVTSPARLVGVPDVPTAIEAGLSDMIAQGFGGLFAPRATPNAVIEQIAGAIRTAMADRELHDVFVASGFEPQIDSGPESTRRFIEEEIRRWTPVVRAIGLKLE